LWVINLSYEFLFIGNIKFWFMTFSKIGLKIFYGYHVQKKFKITFLPLSKCSLFITSNLSKVLLLCCFPISPKSQMENQLAPLDDRHTIIIKPTDHTIKVKNNNEHHRAR